MSDSGRTIGSCRHNREPDECWECWKAEAERMCECHRELRPFPWRCSTCGKEDVWPATIKHTATVKHHGRTHTVEVSDLPVRRCNTCGAVLMGNESHERILWGLREKEGLLQPEQIRKLRKDRRLKQREVAEAIHAAPTTLCKWEAGTIVQSRRSDRALRDFFAKTQCH